MNLLADPMKSTLRILCLEDDDEDYGIITYTLKVSGISFVAQRVETKEQFLNALTQFSPDIILSDHSLPKFTSTEALGICKEQQVAASFILVTGAVSDDFAVMCLKDGADDYVLKSHLVKLPSVIENTLKQKEAQRHKLKTAEELKKRNEELSKSNRELDRFVYSVSHNLRAPMQSMLGLVGLAKTETNFDTLRKYHEMMEASILKLDEALQEILEYSKNAKQKTRLEKVSLKKIIEENLERMQFMPGFDNIVKEINIDEETPLYSDAYRLSVIFNNLISNAVKYHDPNKRISFIKISGVTTREAAVIEFQDNGIGIHKNALPKIFNMFFRATDKREGAGLGLYIVKEAIEMLHGKIDVGSNVGEGTYFKIEIPNQAKRAKKEKAAANSDLVDRG